MLANHFIPIPKVTVTYLRIHNLSKMFSNTLFKQSIMDVGYIVFDFVMEIIILYN